MAMICLFIEVLKHSNLAKAVFLFYQFYFSTFNLNFLWVLCFFFSHMLVSVLKMIHSKKNFQVAAFVKGGWIQEVKPSSYRFPNAEKVLLDAIDVAGPALGPTLISLSEYLITSLNESYQSRYVHYSQVYRYYTSIFLFIIM